MSDTGNFIVVFKEGVTHEQIDDYAMSVENSGGQVKNRYDLGAGVLNGFSAAIPASVYHSLVGDDRIAYIEPDGVVTIQ